MLVTFTDLSKMIDHSLLHPTMTDADIRKGCERDRRYNVATACVKPYAIALARSILSGSTIAVCAVIGFPHGNSSTRNKVIEADEAARAGGAEIDMVINIGKALGGGWACVCVGLKNITYDVEARG